MFSATATGRTSRALVLIQISDTASPAMLCCRAGVHQKREKKEEENDTFIYADAYHAITGLHNLTKTFSVAISLITETMTIQEVV